MKRVLVTGGSGFVGRYCLQDLLDRGYEVHAIATRPGAHSGVQWHAVNLLDDVQTSDVIREIHATHLLHLAWVTQPGRYATTIDNLDWLAVSLRLMKTFHEAGGERIVMAGTCAEYDWSDGFCSEATTPLNPSTLYGRCKVSLQTTLADFARQTKASHAWGRLFFMYGPHAHLARMPGSVIESLLRGEPALCSHGEQIRDFLHIRDAANALVTLLESDLQGPINIASGQPIAIKEMVQRIAERLDRRQLLRLGALPQAAGDPPKLIADVHRLNTELRWQPSLTLDAGLEDTIQWHLQAHGREAA